MQGAALEPTRLRLLVVVVLVFASLWLRVRGLRLSKGFCSCVLFLFFLKFWYSRFLLMLQIASVVVASVYCFAPQLSWWVRWSAYDHETVWGKILHNILASQQQYNMAIDQFTLARTESPKMSKIVCLFFWYSTTLVRWFLFLTSPDNDCSMITGPFANCFSSCNDSFIGSWNPVSTARTCSGSPPGSNQVYTYRNVPKR